MAEREPVIVERTVSVPPEAVWPYLTSGALWSRWQGESAVIEPQPGGVFSMRMPDGPMASGTVVEVVPPRRLVLTWGWIGAPFELPPGSTTVTFELERLVGGFTRITVTHADLPDDLVGHHRGGWVSSLEHLEVALGD